MNLKEQKAKEILEKLLPGYIFTKVRIFKNPETGRKLEFDLYNDKLKLAVEYQGSQHYIEDSYFNKIGGDFAFEKQKARDLIKENLCRINDIDLIEIPNLKNNEIEEYLTEALIKRDYIKNMEENIEEKESKKESKKEEKTKTCNACGEEKSLNKFNAHKGTKDGHRGDCKSCFYSKRKKQRENQKIIEKEKQVEKPNNKKLTKNIILEMKTIVETIEKIDDINNSKYIQNINTSEQITMLTKKFNKKAKKLISMY